ncbi:hypothetical protein SIPHO063v1_p0031 [Vibrio phage PS10B.1]|nr:hypothetical protein SIPHO063v1_p0031 [Vibrio phage PS10B.1]
MSDFKFTPPQLGQRFVDLTRELMRDAAEQLENKKTKVLFELLQKHLGYEPTVTEALTNLKHSPQADGSDLYLWGGVPIVTFNGLKPQPFTKHNSDPYTVTHTIEYQSHVG